MANLYKALKGFALSCLIAASAGAEVVTLSNGDRLTGKIAQTGDSQIVLTTQFGDIAIPRTSITAISADSNSATVSQQASDAGTANDAAAQSPAVAADPTAPEAKAREPEWITGYRNFVQQNFPEGWQFRLRGGLEYRETTSSNFAVYAAFDVKKEWDLNHFSATAYYNYTRETTVADVTNVTLDKWGIDTNFRRDFNETRRWYAQNILAYKKDMVKGIKDQVDEAVTLGYRFEIDRYNLVIDVAPGPAIRYINAENFSTKWAMMAVLAEDITWEISKLLRFEQNGYLGLNVTNVNQYSAYFRLGLVVKASDVMDIALRYSYDYDGINAVTAQREEQRLLLSFEFPFNWK